ncbi:hypothetical protein [Amycolatopsis sp. lyj-23]|uniref:hypothetical protein n=1 Tax=Amycolatopsis sp. lyj-23 TaxID=2789283 RepID=UPI00397A7979
MSKNKSPIGLVVAKFKAVVIALGCLMFGMGYIAQAPKAFLAALGVLSALFLVKLYQERKRR